MIYKYYIITWKISPRFFLCIQGFWKGINVAIHLNASYLSGTDFSKKCVQVSVVCSDWIVSKYSLVNKYVGIIYGGGTFRRWTTRRRTFRRRFIILFYFSSFEEKTMKEVILWMPLSVNLFRLESSILTRAKWATSRNNEATEKRI